MKANLIPSIRFFLMGLLALIALIPANAQYRRSYRSYDSGDDYPKIGIGLAPLSLLTRSGKVNLRSELAYSDNKSVVLLVGVPRPTKVPRLIAAALETDDAEGETTTNRFTSFGLTLEHRFYLGHEAPGGFYLAPYGRYNSFAVTRTRLNESNGGETTIKGRIGGAGIGGALGAQFKLGGPVYMDITFVGIDFKWTRARLTYTTTDPTNNIDEWRDEVQAELEKIPIIGSRLAAQLDGDKISVRSPSWVAPAYRFNLAVSYVF